MPLKKIHISHQSYFITTNVINRKRIFGGFENGLYIPNGKLCQVVIDDLIFYRKKFGFLLNGYVIMPDHFHGIITTGSGGNISEIMRDFKSHVSFEINRILKIKGKFWQEDFYEHCIRNEKDFNEKLNYIHYNPVRANLIKELGDFKYSSYMNYFLNDQSIIKVDMVN